MEETIKTTPAQIEEQFAELVPLQVIRTETVLSKLPIHNLAKKGNVDINIVRKNKDGEIDLKWIVSYSDRYGQPRQIGYKLDTIVINRRIDETPRPLPELIRLGSLREIALELGLGSDTSSVRKALLQNSSAYITARLQYTATDKRQRTLEAGFSRYSVIFTGDKLPTGEKADAVFIELNARYRDVLNNALFRPLNYDYMRELSPAPQRFYEVVSRPMFAALKHQHAEARLSYSEYCTCSAQQRYYDYDRFKKQMYKIHRSHLASGYLKAFRYEPTKDAEGNADWNMFYTPGPKARAEYHTFTKSGRNIDAAPEMARSEIAITPRTPKPRTGSRQKRFAFSAPSGDDAKRSPALAELTRRGIAPRKAEELLGGADLERVIDQLEWGDFQIAQSGGKIRNPAGFYIHIIEQKIPPPPEFETSRHRKAREEAAAVRDRQRWRQLELEEAYGKYREHALDDYLASQAAQADFKTLVAAKAAEGRREFKSLPAETIAVFAERRARIEIAERVGLLTFEAFIEREGQNRPTEA